MNGLPLHPAIVHVPLGLAVVAPLLALGLAIAIRKGTLPRTSWAIVVVLQAVLFAGGLLALKTGEQDEERVEDRIAESAIERHEELAERFVWSAGGTLVLGTAVLILRSHVATSALMAATTLATVVTLGTGLQAGHAGGALVYAPATVTGDSDGPPRADQRDDD
jgi:uncharacterized membrane protein